jgi:hypothetical protein
MITFRLKSPSAKKDTPIRMHCYLNNEEIVVYTRLKINPLFWIKEDQRVTKDLSKFLHGRKYNFELTRLEGIGNSLTVSLQTDEKKTTKKNFKALFEEKAFNIKIRSKIPKLYTGSAFFRNFDNFMMYSDFPLKQYPETLLGTLWHFLKLRTRYAQITLNFIN